MVKFHTGYRLRDTDVRDVSALCERFGIDYPDEYQAARGMLWSSQMATGCENALRLRVFGTKASLSFDQENPANIIVARANGFHNPDFTRTADHRVRQRT